MINLYIKIYKFILYVGCDDPKIIILRNQIKVSLENDNKEKR
jgi:hypothetical protein